MSIEALAIVLNHSKATGAVKLILMGVANHINPDNDGAWPSQVKLAGYANCTERYVRKALDELVELGEIKFETHGGKSAGGNKSNRYWLTISCPSDCDGSVNHRIGKPRTLSQNTPNSVSNTPNPSSVEPYIEPLKETITSKRKSHIKEDWLPSESLHKIIDSKEKWATVNATDELEKFINYHMAKGSMMVDWDRAFMTWLTNAERWAKDKAAPTIDKSNIKGWFE